MTDEEFFNQLLEKTEIAFQKTSLKDKGWNYSICGTPLYKGKGLIVGINWGGREKTSPQNSIPTGEDISNYIFIKKLKPFLEEHLKVINIKEINYSNICFFRTPELADLSNKDRELSMPLFVEYVNYIKPEWILLLTTQINFLPQIDIADWQKEDAKSGNRTFSAYKAKSNNLIEGDIYAFPHPIARIKSEARIELWNKIFSTNGQNKV